jgi:tRNA G18 (ribose-2'-O)-methylase SpoU
MNIVLILHNIRSVYNVGSIFRTADAGGVSKIYLIGVTPTPKDRFGGFRKDFSKVALGAEKIVEWERVEEFFRVCEKLKKDGFEVLAVEQDKRSIPYNEYRLNKKNSRIALVFGEETKGLQKSVLDKCDEVLEIPMRGKKESLNVSVAVGIVVFHLTHN